jgi:hypothetical protein
MITELTRTSHALEAPEALVGAIDVPADPLAPWGTGQKR